MLCGKFFFSLCPAKQSCDTGGNESYNEGCAESHYHTERCPLERFCFLVNRHDRCGAWIVQQREQHQVDRREDGPAFAVDEQVEDRGKNVVEEREDFCENVLIGNPDSPERFANQSPRNYRLADARGDPSQSFIHSGFPPWPRRSLPSRLKS